MSPNPIHEGFAFMTQSPLKGPHPLIPCTLEIRISMVDFQGRQAFSLYHVSKDPISFLQHTGIRVSIDEFEGIHSVHNTHINKAQETIPQTFLSVSQLFPSFIRNMSQNASAHFHCTSTFHLAFTPQLSPKSNSHLFLNPVLTSQQPPTLMIISFNRVHDICTSLGFFLHVCSHFVFGVLQTQSQILLFFFILFFQVLPPTPVALLTTYRWMTPSYICPTQISSLSSKLDQASFLTFLCKDVSKKEGFRLRLRLN